MSNSNNNTSNFSKKKNLNDKEIQEFFFLIEDKLSDRNQIEKFSNLINDTTLTEEEVLTKLKELFTSSPILILELNKFLPKSNKLPLLEQENADNFLKKLRNKDEGAFKEIIKIILSYKNKEINFENVITKFEEILCYFPDLLEEAYLFIDYKKLLNKKNFTKIPQKIEKKQQPSTEKKIPSSSEKTHYIHSPTTINKLPSSPDSVFFSSLKKIFPNSIYNILIKLLYLYNEGVLSQYEFTQLIQPYFKNRLDHFEYLKNLSYSKMMNRKEFAIFNKPMYELFNYTKNTKVDSYFELPKEYPNRISSGRKPEEEDILNDRLITIPKGSEDDKNPMKKNHYEENLFKFEDERYEIDMIIEIYKYVHKILKNYYDEIVNKKINMINEKDLIEKIGEKNIKFIKRFYKDCGDKIIEGILHDPKNALNVIIKRFNIKITDSIKKKKELEKSIKIPFDRVYQKSFDYRSFKFKNFDKKNNNHKAFLKEILKRKKEKFSCSNINVLKGGTDNCEFFSTLNLKLNDKIINKLKEENDNLILIKEKDIEKFKGKLPEIKIIFYNIEILKLTFALIFYQIFNTNNIDNNKVIEFFSPLIKHFFNFELKNLFEYLKDENNLNNEKNVLNNEIIEKIKDNKILTYEEYNKYYNLEHLSKLIEIIPIENENENNEETEKKSEISLTPSLQSQDNGKSFRDILILNHENSNSNIDCNKILFYPPKGNNEVIFYSNENCYVLIIFIFCIYERLNQLNEYSIENEEKLFNLETNKDLAEKIENLKKKFKNNNISIIFKNFIIIYMNLFHKKIENNLYEELCRELLVNESYFLFNMDKLLSSLIKTISIIIQDNLSKEILKLFSFEINRKLSPNEKLYFSNYIQLLDNNSQNNFRILINKKLLILTIHLMELPIEHNKKEYYDQFKEFVNKTLNNRYTEMYNDNQSTDDPFNIYLNRNVDVIKSKQNKKVEIFENNLVFRFDYSSKKLQYLKSDCDILFRSKGKINKKERMLKLIHKNLLFKSWINNEINK